MKERYDLNTECQSAEIEEKAVLLGYANMVIFNCKQYSTFRILTLDFWISPAINHKQILFLFDITAKPIGYVIWAHLAPDTEQRLMKDLNFLLHPSEWNEGGRTWIIDFCFPCGGVSEVVRKLKILLQKKSIYQVFWVRRNSDYSVRKSMSCRLQRSQLTYTTQPKDMDELDMHLC